MSALTLGWGLDPYGTGLYGSKLAGIGIRFQAALALSTNTVEVTLTGAAQYIGPSGIGDALNPATWAVQNLATSEFYNVVSVEEVTPERYILTLINSLGPATATHRVSSFTLLDEGGGPSLAPHHADFAGLLGQDVGDADLEAAAKGAQSTDIANPPAPSASGDQLGGTLLINGSGDYESVTGAELVRKLIMRRLVSAPGDFFHLPDYGVGLRVKEPLPSSDLVRLKSEVERQAKLEREVSDAQASIIQAGNSLTIQLRAKLQSTDQQIDVVLPMSTSNLVVM